MGQLYAPSRSVVVAKFNDVVPTAGTATSIAMTTAPALVRLAVSDLAAGRIMGEVEVENEAVRIAGCEEASAGSEIVTPVASAVVSAVSVTST